MRKGRGIITWKEGRNFYGCKKAKEEISVNADTNIISPLLRNVFKFQSGSHNVCFSFSFANRVLVLEYRAALGPSQGLFCPVLTLQSFEELRPVRHFLWDGRFYFEAFPFTLFFAMTNYKSWFKNNNRGYSRYGEHCQNKQMEYKSPQETSLCIYLCILIFFNFIFFL